MIRRPLASTHGLHPAHRLVIGLLLLAGCSGGNDGSGGPLPPAPPATCMTLSGTTAAAPGTVVAQAGSGSTCARIAVDLVITGVADIFAIELTAVFDASLYSLDGVSTQGSILESGGAAIQILQSGPSGQKLIAITRLNPAGGVNMDGKLATLFFRKVANSGSGALTFSSPKVLNSQAPPSPIPNITWFGGTLSVQ